MRRYILLFSFLLFVCAVGFGQSITPAGPVGFCPGGSVTLTITGAPVGSTYRWLKGGAPFGGTGVTQVVNSAGTYTAIVTIAGVADTLNDVVVVAYPQPAADFTFNNNNACSGTSIAFTSSVSVGSAPFTYSWNFGDGSPLDVTQNPSHTFTSLGCGTGTFNVTLTVTDANGCKVVVGPKSISVKQAPDVRLTDQNVFSPFSNCGNSPTPSNPNYTITVNNASVGSCIGSYTVDWGDGSAVNSSPTFPLTHTYTQLGAFNLVITGVGSNGCTGSKTYTIANQRNPDIGLGTVDTTIGCVPLQIKTIVSQWQTNSPGTTYVLSFGDGSFLNLTHPLVSDTFLHTYTTSPCPSPVYQLKITATNACKSKSFQGGDIEPRTKPQPKFSIPRATYCVNTSVCFTNETTPGFYTNCSTITNYTWDFGDGSPVSTDQSPCHIYTTPGVYTVSLTTSNPCGAGTVTKPVCITAAPTSSFTLDKTAGCAPQIITATNASSTGASCATGTYLWKVAYTASNCGAAGAGNYFTSGTSNTSVSTLR